MVVVLVVVSKKAGALVIIPAILHASLTGIFKQG
jgi:hypothetical protein